MRGVNWGQAVLLLVAALAAIATPADAASRTCRQLQAELNATPVGGNPVQIRKYDDAIRKQQGELAKARSQARAAGCGFSLFGANVSQCAVLNAALGRMNANLDALGRKRAQLARKDTRRDKARLAALLRSKNCNGQDRAKASAKARRETPLDRAPDAQPDEASVRSGSSGNSGIIVLRGGGMPARGGVYRTLCVRTCDGYFFPMSTTASAGEFERDQKNCESSCPGTQMQLFYTRRLGDDSATMISTASGRPYAELRTAYLYKRSDAAIPRGCGCNAAQDYQIIGGNGRSPAGGYGNDRTQGSFFIPVPAARPDPAADPESQANAEGGLDRAALRALIATPQAAPTSETAVQERKVRVVGPAFLPALEAAEDRQAPVRTPTR